MDENHHSSDEATIPTIYVISDSVGVTGQAVARAAAVQFGVSNPDIDTLPKVSSFMEIKEFLDARSEYHKTHFGDPRILVFYTLVDDDLAEQLTRYCAENPRFIGVDLMTDATRAIAEITGREPSAKPGGLHVADSYYFRRIEAVEFTIDHDDGRRPHELGEADIVLLGVSRTSKTPLSIYLSQQGYKVANIPLDLYSDPPKEIYNVDRTRLFGLVTDPDLLVSIRKRRLGAANSVAKNYADPTYVYEELDSARRLMRRLGCIVIHTEKRAVEETAQEILMYYEHMHDSSPQAALSNHISGTHALNA
ncbi:MAG: pyruvate, water dikinase regulatory protein [Eggerthellaceae bacterium]|jgi:regulator of PEP synthase PpsR (kinase-PPPase family)